ncbi:unnamed protein product [Toxocara canis]|uniref:SCP domain-containing protein n=1 Tax=Toxocara canis TaxID=6265 RepID=A0A183V421_TOXCA|nr:unnamed protein product [Toxocara canis]
MSYRYRIGIISVSYQRSGIICISYHDGIGIGSVWYRYRAAIVCVSAWYFVDDAGSHRLLILMLLLLPALLLVTSTFATGSQCPGVTNAKFDDATREKIIAKHNEYRSKIAHGTAKYKGGQTLSSGKNVYALSWDCSLEQSAQNWSDRCEFDPSYPDDFGENYDEFNATNPMKVAMEAMEDWWRQLEQYDASSNINITFNDDVYEYAMHWSQRAPQGYSYGYEKRPLQIVTGTGQAAGSQCPWVTNAKFDEAARAAIVAKHNEYRSKIAHGTAKYKGGQTLSSGKNVYALSWDCGLEQSAQDWSDRCEFDPSYPDDFGENYDEFNATNPMKVAMEAMEDWWGQLKQYDASSNPNITFNDDVYEYAMHWSQVQETVLSFS